MTRHSWILLAVIASLAALLLGVLLPRLRSSRRPAAALAVLPASAPAELGSPPPPAAPAALGVVVSPVAALLAVPGDAVVIALPDQVALVPESGGPPIPILAQGVTTCKVDPVGEVLWFTQPTPEAPRDWVTAASFDLLALDLRHPETRWLIATSLPVQYSPRTGTYHYELQIRYAEHTAWESAFDEGAGAYGVELELRLDDPPTLQADLQGCAGESGFFCYDESGSRPRPHFQETLAALSRAKLVGATALRELAKREGSPLVITGVVSGRDQGQQRDAAAEPDASSDSDADAEPELPEIWPDLKPSACHGFSESSCGKLTALEGTELATIHFGEDLPGMEGGGDFNHSYDKLYDVRRQLFIDPCDPTLTAKQPLDERVPLLHDTYVVSRSGKLWLTSSAVCRPGQAPLPLPEKAQLCGLLRKPLRTLKKE